MILTEPPAPPALPSPPHSAAPSPFPLLATLAPILGSLAMWLITSSPIALLFAALGPLIAIASLLDRRVHARRQHRRAARELREELRRTIEGVVATRAASIDDPDDFPGVADPQTHGTGSWAEIRRDGALELTLGRAEIGAEPLELSASGLLGLDPELDAELRGLAEVASSSTQRLRVVTERRIVITGSETLARALARVIALQLIERLSPAAWRVHAPESEVWADDLPHRRRAIGAARIVLSADGEEDIVIDWTASVSRGRMAIDVGGQHPPGVLNCPGPGLVSFAPAAVSIDAARSWASSIARTADPEQSASTPTPPERLALSELDQAGDVSSPVHAERAGLVASIGHDGVRPVTIDLVSEGPHAIVAGTTGTGKSELLVSWIVALAARYPVSDVTFLLVDFKGGSGFLPVEKLPHIAGVLSDLDAGLVRRAVESLRAELQRRERELAAARVRDIAELRPGVLPRLVIVVDEFAAVVREHPELHEVFADLAARGRSLGMHLVLCTQRPSGTIRDSVFANADIRISLRVSDRGDSVAVVGTAAALELPAQPRGRAVISVAGSPPRELQIALADAGATRRASEDSDPQQVVRRPWSDPLPERIALGALAGREHASAAPVGPFGVIDRPAEQRHGVAEWDPGRDGNLLVVGTSASGKSSALAAIGESASLSVDVVPADPASAWAAIDRMSAAPHGDASGPRIVLVDDLDAVVAAMGAEHAAAFTEELVRLCRESSRRRVWFAASVSRVAGPVSVLAAAFASRIVLRAASREDHVLAGGEPGLWSVRAVPGRGEWRGEALQLAHPQTLCAPRAEVAERFRASPGSVIAVVSRRPARSREIARAVASEVEVRPLHPDAGAFPGPDPLVRSDGDRTRVLLGRPEEWMSQWAAISSLGQGVPVLFHGCSPAEIRTLTRVPALPPVLGDDPEECVLFDGDFHRVRISAE